MKKLFIVSMLLVLGCQAKKSDGNNATALKLTREYIDISGQGEKRSYTHYISLEGCGRPYCNFNTVLEMAKQYYDSCSTKKPIGSIYLIRHGDGYEFEGNEPDFNKVFQNAVFAIHFKDDSNNRSSFPIKEICFFENGERREIDMDKLDSLRK